MRKPTHLFFLFAFFWCGATSAIENYVAPSSSDLQPRPGYARVFIYRPQASIGRYGFGYGVAFKFTFDGKPVGALKQDECTLVFLHPGTYTAASAKHSFWNGVEDYSGSLTVSDNSTYYLSMYGDVAPPLGTISNVTKVMSPQTGWWYEAFVLSPEKEGEEALTRCTYKPPIVPAI